MATFQRRTILKAMAAGLLPMPGLGGLAFAEAPGRILITLHLRGGMDGLNLISPADDPDFVAAREVGLRVVPDGAEPGYALAQGPDPRIDFRLHAAAGGMAELYQAGHLAFIHAAGLTDATRSHFVATDMMDRGIAGAAALARTDTGWLTRVLGPGMGPGTELRAVSASGQIAGELAGGTAGLAVPDLGGGLAVSGGPPVAAILARLYAGAEGTAGVAGRRALEALAGIDHRLPRDDKGHVVAYQADPAAHYDDAQEFARPLKVLAQLIKLDLGLRAATLDLGGWDTHEGQAGRFKAAVTRLSNGIAAFWNDLSAWHDRIDLVTITEFGRRLRSNRSGGTDHGRAGVMAVLGGRVRGGRFYGAWPGLGADHLEEGVDLAVTTDYRQVLAEVLAASGDQPALAFPGLALSRLGLYG